jgi:hypothetical protein
MNILLYKYESGNRNQYHSPVPIETVWKKVLMSPDPSKLEIFYRGKRVGNCRWVAGAGEEQMRKFLQSEEGEPTKNNIQNPTTYTIDLDGNVMVKDFRGSLRFYFHSLLKDENTWSNLSIRVNMEKMTIHLNAFAANESLILRIETPDQTFSKKFTFAELMNPSAILQSIGGPFLALLLPELPALGSNTNQPGANLKIEQRAYNYNLTIGNTTLRTYRVEVKLMERFKAVATISRAGEILKIELPDNIVLINEALVSL